MLWPSQHDAACTCQTPVIISVISNSLLVDGQCASGNPFIHTSSSSSLCRSSGHLSCFEAVVIGWTICWWRRQKSLLSPALMLPWRGRTWLSSPSRLVGWTPAITIIKGIVPVLCTFLNSVWQCTDGGGSTDPWGGDLHSSDASGTHTY